MNPKGIATKSTNTTRINKLPSSSGIGIFEVEVAVLVDCGVAEAVAVTGTVAGLGFVELGTGFVVVAVAEDVVAVVEVAGVTVDVVVAAVDVAGVASAGVASAGVVVACLAEPSLWASVVKDGDRSTAKINIGTIFLFIMKVYIPTQAAI